MRSIGLSPTKAPSTKTCAADGTERNSNLQAFFPACCSRPWRFTTSGGGPTGAARCCGLLGSCVTLAGVVQTPGFGWLATAVPETVEEAPEYSVMDWARDTVQLRMTSRQADSADRASDEKEPRNSTTIFIAMGVRAPSQFHCGS